MMHYIKRVVKKSLSLLSNGIVCFVPKRKVRISVEDAEYILEQYHADPKTSALWLRPAIEYDHDLTIIIPVYNVEKYLEKCLESLVNQKTDFSYDVIVVNDCSPDNSIFIMEKYKEHPLIKIVHHECTRGVSAARNTGLQLARGRYIMFVDSDDFLTENAVHDLMSAAYRCDADIVQGGYYEIDSSTEKLLGSMIYTNRESVPPNGVLAGMPWGKVYNARLFSNVCFPEKYWFQDTIVTGLLTHLAERILTITDMVYYYRINPSGITGSSKHSSKAVDTLWVHQCVLKARVGLGLPTDIKFYEHLLRMIILSYKRTKHTPETIRLSLFVAFRDMLLSVRESHFVVNKRYTKLEKAIIEGNYRRYSILCNVL